MADSVFAHHATRDTDSDTDTVLTTSTELFDDLGKRYEVACAHNEAQGQSLQWLIERLPRGSKVYDIGCGTGRPASSTLAEAGMVVTGIDISPVMLAIATDQVPKATFIQADLRTWEPHPSLDAADCVVAFFSLTCDVTQDDIRGFFIRVYRWLKPGASSDPFWWISQEVQRAHSRLGGIFIFGTIPLAGNMVPFKWLGKKSIGSGLDVHDNLNSINAAGFCVEKHDLTLFNPHAEEAGLCGKEEASPEEHLFVYARRP